MIIATLPPIHQISDMTYVIENEHVAGYRYNTAAKSALGPGAIVKELMYIMKQHPKKKLYIDLKGRQLRIAKWAVPTYGDIVLNKKIKIDYPAAIYFRGSSKPCFIIRVVDGDHLYVNPNPQYAVGEGQAVNILCDNLIIEGEYLTDLDKEFIEACRVNNCPNLMLSFVEKASDIFDVKKIYPEAELTLKIESLKGVNLVWEMANHKHDELKDCRLMAARDDLFTQLSGDWSAYFFALHSIVLYDPEAICASQLMMGLGDNCGNIIRSSDITDVAYMQHLGYKNFMVSDDISQYHFRDALNSLLRVGVR